jgi:hypothetical protein
MQAGWVLAIAEIDDTLAHALIAPPSIVMQSLPDGSLAGGRPDPQAWPWESAATFKDEVRQRGEWRGGNSRAWIRALDVAMYDPEHWATTPPAEQRDPVAATRLFAALGHRLGVRVLVTPGLNLVSVPGGSCVRRPGETSTAAFLRCDVIGRMAPFVDLIEVQAQSLQHDANAYAAFVEQAAAQARAANTDVTVIAGLTTGHSFTASEMYAAWNAVRGTVDGYYLSISGNGRVATAVSFLRRVPFAVDMPSAASPGGSSRT